MTEPELADLIPKPQFLQDLEQDGFVVVPNVLPKPSCDEFVEQAWEWLESASHGFRRDDRSTWTAEHLPYGHDRGLYNRYCVNHEAFVWRIRSHPGILKVFSQVWGTDDLIASFDGINISLPVNPEVGRTDIAATKPWPHIDQNPRTIDKLELYQGIANIAPNGPLDGGLVVLSGSHKLHTEHFDSTGGFRAHQDSGLAENGYNFLPEDVAWYHRQGCKQVKICANAGDLILWDSRTIHWNCTPTQSQTRFAAYVCYCPRSRMSDEDLKTKSEIFDLRKGTTHWPNKNIVPADRPGYHYAKPRRPDDSLDSANRERPFNEPHVTPSVLSLVGVRP
ncbi:unnamed protein product [Zymoseptoria tritici ST99CH_1A5]|uniref:Phytanoyl-CoA dioxygenase n=3 Tax=Zymoseptoria tritici TaxID=1047171 RepID=F9X3N3_ZYMTI|nr:uncharacterized protein MYCGRDRAFT_99133 [Zymoseptoria tritici IPO323]EGP90512.1 hypothetical protein MYCGRDRAFT_99133 [Zymoseptoria tritici IPO323]SMR46195.1 unnamed protein product [Zymoseptoria tritici ST99CH_1E4]SMY21343.1 unnamed protein product [Zymoseptoria tritici ST99CH_1A5]